MLKIITSIEALKIHFLQIQNKATRFQWVDKSTSALKILAPIPDPWNSTWEILIRLNQGKTRAGITYPRGLELVCLAPATPESGGVRAEVMRERWKGHFAHSTGVCLFFAAFPVAKAHEADHNWLLVSVIDS